MLLILCGSSCWAGVSQSDIRVLDTGDSCFCKYVSLSLTFEHTFVFSKKQLEICGYI